MTSWETADWPLTSNVEVDHRHFEDLRKWAWLLSNMFSAGFTNRDAWTIWTIATWGDYRDVGGDDVPDPPGTAVIKFEHPDTGVVRYYTNNNWIYDTSVNGAWTAAGNPKFHKPGEPVFFDCRSNPPVFATGVENTMQWKKVPDPNRYHHWDYNRDTWSIFHSGGNMAYAWSAYTARYQAHEYYPRSVDPYNQVPPVGTSSDTSTTCSWIYDPVEFDKDYITNKLYTKMIPGTSGGWSRAYSGDLPTTPNGGIGIWPEKSSCYIMSTPHPFDNSMDADIFQYHSGLLLTSAYQDMILTTIENSSRFVLKADANYIADFITWQKQKATAWTISTSYGRDDTVTNGGTYYLCIDDHYSSSLTEPGVGASWEGYWSITLYDPTYIGSHPIYPDLDDRFWNCNESGFERCLEEVGRYDWWWDATAPPLTYDIHNWLMIEYRFGSPPDPTKYPLPLGCWRRTWKYSMRGLTGRVMWPQEFGDPNIFFNLAKNRMIVNQYQYDNAVSAAKPYYQVKDVDQMIQVVEEKLRARVPGDTADRTWEDILEGRHGPSAIDEYKIGPVWYEDELFEIKCQMLQNMHDVVQVLQMMKVQDLVSIARMTRAWFNKGVSDEPSSIEVCESAESDAYTDKAAVGPIVEPASGKACPIWYLHEADTWLCVGYYTGYIKYATYYDYSNRDSNWYIGYWDESARKGEVIIVIGTATSKTGLDDVDTDEGDGKVKIPVAHGGDFAVGDIVVIENLPVRDYAGWHEILEVPDDNSFVINHRGYVWGYNWDGETVKKYSGLSQMVGEFLLRVLVKANDYKNSPDSDAVKVGFAGKTITFPEPPVAFADPEVKNIYMPLRPEDYVHAPAIFGTEIRSQSPTAGGSSRTYLSQNHSAGLWARSGLMQVNGKDEDGEDLHNWIVTKINWDGYTSTPMGNVFRNDCIVVADTS